MVKSIATVEILTVVLNSDQFLIGLDDHRWWWLLWQVLKSPWPANASIIVRAATFSALLAFLWSSTLAQNPLRWPYLTIMCLHLAWEGRHLIPFMRLLVNLELINWCDIDLVVINGFIDPLAVIYGHILALNVLLLILLVKVDWFKVMHIALV